MEYAKKKDNGSTPAEYWPLTPADSEIGDCGVADEHIRLLDDGGGSGGDSGQHSDCDTLRRHGRSVRAFRVTEGSISMDADIPYKTDDDPKPAKRCMSVQGCLKKVYKLLRSLLGLVITLLAYTFFGAWIIMAIEGPAETTQRAEALDQVLQERRTVADQLRNSTRDLQAGLVNETEWERRTEALLLGFEQSVIDVGVSTTSVSKPKWTFLGSVLFCVTTYTTIGYGNIAPVTKAGRIATMLYATIGIPLALIVLADLGRRLTAALKFLWSFVRRYYYTGYCRKVRNRRRGTYDIAEDGANGKGKTRLTDKSNARNEDSDAIRYTQESETKGTGTLEEQSESSHADDAEGPSKNNVLTNGVVDKLSGGEDEADGRERSDNPLSNADTGVVNGCTQKQVKIELVPSRHSQDRESNYSNCTGSSGANSRRSHEKSPARSTFGPEPEEDFNLPVIVAIGFIFLYIVLGAFMYTLWEDWTYLESFYFVFITACTIGYGDILPKHPNFFLLTCIYTFFGLALVSMVINVIGEFLSKTIDRAKEKVEEAKELAKEKMDQAKAKAVEAKDRLSMAGSKAIHKVDKAKHIVTERISKTMEGTPSPEEHKRGGHKKEKQSSVDKGSSEEPEMSTVIEEPDDSRHTDGANGSARKPDVLI